MGIGESEQRGGQRGDVTLDRRALGAVHQRLRDIDTSIANAESNADLAQATQLSLERQALLDQLAADMGWGRSARRPNDPVERARKAVTARLRDAIRRVEGADRAAGEHLERSVQTGVQCVYLASRSER